ncbi:MAG: bifunctional 4-hydroxy-2-oxoglutarate aldolase/2-dehydro-3-deoxy-phosphogluconate aldolase, partial [Flavitalea sp.]
GAMTPTEISTARDYGADFIKLFPASTLGIEYFKAIQGPFNNLRFLAVGGIDLTNAASWLQAGVSGVGIGGSLTKADPKDIKVLIQSLVQSNKKS